MFAFAEVAGYLRLAVTILGYWYLGLILFVSEYWNDNSFIIRRFHSFTGILIRVVSLEVPVKVLGFFDATNATDLLASLPLVGCRLILHVLGSVHLIKQYFFFTFLVILIEMDSQ